MWLYPVGKEMEDDINLREIEVDIDDMDKNGVDVSSLVKTIIAFKFFFNLVCVAIPWTIIAWLLWLWNIVFNSWLNKGWAEGNFWLLANTAFCTFQTLLTLPLVDELEYYLRRMFFLRMGSVIAAWLYNIAYLTMLADWFYNVYGLTDEKIEELGALDMLMNMFFIYNSILHSGIVIVNFVIIFKELELEFYQMIKGSMTDDYALSWDLAYKSLTEDLWMFNPLTVFDKVNFYLTGYHSIDLIDENPDNRGNYIPNQINKV